MAHTVRITETAEKQLKKLPIQSQVRIAAKIDELRDNPRPDGVKKLKGVASTYRVSVGDYRIVYEVNDNKFVVLVIRIGDRKEVYRD